MNKQRMINEARRNIRAAAAWYHMGEVKEFVRTYHIANYLLNELEVNHDYDFIDENSDYSDAYSFIVARFNEL